MEEYKETELYVPRNISTEYEFISGFGFKELLQTFIITAISAIIAFGVFIVNNDIATFILIIIIGFSAGATFTRKGENNLSVSEISKIYLLTVNSQKKYNYSFFDRYCSENYEKKEG